MELLSVYLGILVLVLGLLVLYLLSILRYMIAIQLEMAFKVGEKVYVYDNIGYFIKGAIVVKNTVRYKQYQDSKAVLSSLAQQKLNLWFYRMLSPISLNKDKIGLYINRNSL